MKREQIELYREVKITLLTELKVSGPLLVREDQYLSTLLCTHVLNATNMQLHMSMGTCLQGWSRNNIHTLLR